MAISKTITGRRMNLATLLFLIAATGVEQSLRRKAQTKAMSDNLGPIARLSALS